jgi:hypothetical protein
MRSGGFAAIELPVKRKRSFDPELFEESTAWSTPHQDQQGALGVAAEAGRHGSFSVIGGLRRTPR